MQALSNSSFYARNSNESVLIFQEEVEEVEEEDEEVVLIEEEEMVTVVQSKPPPVTKRVIQTEVRTELRDAPEPTKLDTRYFGELLAEVYRKNCDIHSCISDHVSRIRR